MKNRILVILLAVLFLLSGCGANENKNGGDKDPIILKFKENFDYQSYDNQTVVIRGYMSTLSPVDGRFIYLMNIPYQTCPFCVPSTTTIVNTVAIYAPGGKNFEFYEGPIEVKGVLKAGNIVDEFGYNYPFKIMNASYSKIDTEMLSKNQLIYSALSKDGIINDLSMFANKAAENCFFEEYGKTEDQIEKVNNSDFEKLITKINVISETDYTELIALIENFKAINEAVNTNIDNKNYALNSSNAMAEKFNIWFSNFNAWLNKYEI